VGDETERRPRPFGSHLATVMPVFHMMGAGVGVKRSEEAFFFVWTL
jgi:hypothetical protein